ncbi:MULTISPECIES: hypothetical protein [unclassified Methylobacterium]|uniref:hypothetical protein n=1 Tax=unclassified Methylobacterium TaxID=2615210 RepID=UPI0011C20DAC|nr:MULTISPECIES: hypothetical protein [unclassified Methylobacterium]QEE41847.1 hypothetical protein FVA80_25860 [Methylobacterium sp. WL1]TXN56371.1 hypothetical protein FV241_15935 [Methylobacterium sp. WL2]
MLDKDMRTLNPTLLRDAIREATEIRKLRLVPPDAQRSLVHQIYTRKIKEFSAIYPFLFAVENGLRSALAEQSAIKFNGVHWWTLIRDARARGQTAQALPTIWTIPVSAAFLKAVWRAFDTIANPLHVQSVSGPGRTDEFFYTLNLGDLWNILSADWSMTRGMFCSDAELGFKLGRKMFEDTMRVIKEARNELYHSNPITDRTKVVGACERILNGLNVHLGDYDTDLATIRHVRVPPTVPRSPRHVIPPR